MIIPKIQGDNLIDKEILITILKIEIKSINNNILILTRNLFRYFYSSLNFEWNNKDKWIKI